MNRTCEKLTERALRAITIAEKAARTSGQEEIGTHHLLMGLLQEGQGVANRALERIGIDTRQAYRSALELEQSRISWEDGAENGAPPSWPAPNRIGLSKKARQVLKLAGQEAGKMDHTYVGTEHILLAILRYNQDDANRSMGTEDLTETRVRDEVRKIMDRR